MRSHQARRLRGMQSDDRLLAQSVPTGPFMLARLSRNRPTTHRAVRTVQRNWTRYALVLGGLMLWMAPGMSASAATAAVSGVVRDARGVAQMGALVEVLAAGSESVATAMTDLHGRYRIADLMPGRYQVRASASLFMPAARRNLRLYSGMSATVNLTLNMLTDPAAWLPAERRKPDEPDGDWRWTLRSVANRPILRIFGDGNAVPVSEDTAETPGGAPLEARASTLSGDGGFGGGGVRTMLALDKAGKGGSQTVVRTEMAAGQGYAPAMQIDAGYERNAGYAGQSRMVVSYLSHPEIVSSGSTTGLQAIRLASAQKMNLGDAVEVEAGSTVYAIRTAETVLTAQPFLRVTVHPGAVWAVRYQLATARDLQDFAGLDSVEAEIPVAVSCGTRPCTESGMHQEIALIRRAGGGVVEAAVYHDAIGRSSIDGMGMAGPGGLAAAELAAGSASSGVAVDEATGSFRYLVAGTTSNGVSLTLSEPLADGLWAALEFESGRALAMPKADGQGLPQGLAGLHPQAAEAETASIQGRVLRTGTRLCASYRWQPLHLVTAVGPYAPFSDQAYLGLYVRQALHWGDRLPPGFEATVNVVNLLAQGYVPFLSTDGRTLYLAQSPRTVQGGISFTF